MSAYMATDTHSHADDVNDHQFQHGFTGTHTHLFAEADNHTHRTADGSDLPESSFPLITMETTGEYADGLPIYRDFRPLPNVRLGLPFALPSEAWKHGRHVADEYVRIDPYGNMSEFHGIVRWTFDNGSVAYRSVVSTYHSNT